MSAAKRDRSTMTGVRRRCHLAFAPQVRTVVQRFVAFFIVAFCAVLSVGARAQTPTMSLAQPSAIIFPFQSTGTVDPQFGPRIAEMIASKLSHVGGVIVKPPEPGIAQADYLTEARRVNADYYVTGYVAPIGRETSLLLQVVSSGSGTIAWSGTTQFPAGDDASAAASLVRTAIRTHFTRAYAMLDIQERNAAAKKNQPSPNPRSRNRANGAAPAPSASPATRDASSGARPALSPAPSGPPVAVFTLTGDAGRYRRAYATDSILRELDQRGMRARIARGTVRDLTLIGDILCARTGATHLVGGTLALSEYVPEFGPWTTAKIAMTGYDCKTRRLQKLAVHNATGPQWQDAINKAVAAAITDLIPTRAAQ